MYDRGERWQRGTRLSNPVDRLAQPTVEEAALGVGSRQVTGTAVRHGRLLRTALAPQHVAPRRRQEVVGPQLAVVGQLIEQRETHGGALAQGDGDGAVEGDDRRRHHLEEPVVEARHLRPVGARAPHVAGGDGGLDLERSGASEALGRVQGGATGGDGVGVPLGAVLLIEDDEVARFVDPGSAAARRGAT